MRKLLSTPFGFVAIIGLFLAEFFLVNPDSFERYANTWHGFYLGLIAFLAGFMLNITGESTWNTLKRWKWVSLGLAVTAYVLRVFILKAQFPMWATVIESNLWIFALLGIGHQYLNRPSKALTYLSTAAYPVYILHMFFLYLGSYLVFPMEINRFLELGLVILITFAGCFITYEGIRRVSFLRPLFGLKFAGSANQKLK